MDFELAEFDLLTDLGIVCIKKEGFSALLFLCKHLKIF